MTARLIDGRALADRFRAEVAARVAAVKGRSGRVRLDAVIVGDRDDPAHVYAINQGRTCEQLGIEYKLHTLPSAAGFDDIAGRVLLLNTQDECSAIMLHLPLPNGVDPYTVQRLIAPEKDVEGVNPANIGNIVYGRSSLAPCTALAVSKMVEHTLGAGAARHGKAARPDGPGPLAGKLVVVVGASDVVGKPIAVLLMRHDATVVSCNKWTPGMKDLCRAADVLVAAAGVPDLIQADMVKPGATVVDVGVNRVAGPDGKMRTVGDVAFEAVSRTLGPSGWISPVPGGVGPMTVMMLLVNVVQTAERAVGL
ncbi:MAG: bifunctional 5,10-methylenetetrahydrofolate dehydrogenase/5,10-methenyltetrahydrofolate cyclohydrolase [Phycisphaerales bacterium]